MKNRKVLITAGPTYEAIDPVRFIGNRSTGKMGYSIAEELRDAGFDVTLITGPSALEIPQNIAFVKVQSAEEMYQACSAIYEEMDVAIFSAAVADYTPKVVSDIKIKKNDDALTLELIKTKDIAKELGKRKQKHQLNIGFALETNNEEENALSKLSSKNLDFVILNSLRNEGTCFGSDNNKITILEHNKRTAYEFKTKEEVAKDIVKYIIQKI